LAGERACGGGARAGDTVYLCVQHVIAALPGVLRQAVAPRELETLLGSEALKKPIRESDADRPGPAPYVPALAVQTKNAFGHWPNELACIVIGATI
jgi:hypothetical protein